MKILESLYHIGYSIKKRHSLSIQRRLPYKVISIGNMVVGGTGKTPATIAIAEEAKKRGFNPIILTRGYKGKAKRPCLVTPSPKNSTAPSLLFGDEPLLIAGRLKDVVVVKCADRHEGGMFALHNLAPTNLDSQPFNCLPVIFILDDGFQHWRLYRDLDIVLIDGLDPFGNRKMLPMGPLRGPLKELKGADIFVITKAQNEALSDELKGINREAPLYFSECKILKVRDIRGSEVPQEVLRGKRIYAFCGLANPESFRETVLSIGGELSGFKTFRDHHRYTGGDLRWLKKQFRRLNCDFLVATEKDMVKLRELDTPEDILYLEIRFCIDSSFFDKVFESIL
ncbi:tetraacyldisaccharide 4'-kinase [Thermodesulfovibrionales bacterium]|nr:tetraacyldisaccharide 4'-kinase [Thermodesulfovibrionales bacterium]